MKNTRPRTPTCFELKRLLKKEGDPRERERLKGRIYAKEHRDKVREYSARYREAHPLTRKERKRIYEAYMERRFSGRGKRYAMK